MSSLIRLESKPQVSRPAFGRRFQVAIILMIAVVASTPVLAGELIGVRVGTHPGFTRIVFESEGVIRFQEPSVHENGECLIQFDAVTTQLPETMTFGESVEWIHMQRDGESLIARMKVPFDRFRTKLFTLSEPDRVVLDLVPDRPVVQRKEEKQEAAASEPISTDPTGKPLTDVSNDPLVPSDACNGPSDPVIDSPNAAKFAGISSEFPVRFLGLLGLTLGLMALAYFLLRKEHRARSIGALPDFDRRFSQRIADLDLQIQRELAKYDRLTRRERP